MYLGYVLYKVWQKMRENTHSERISAIQRQASFENVVWRLTLF